jgi:hypothetical protein
MTLSLSTFRPEAEMSEQRALFRQCFPETCGYPAETLDFYRWKFHSFPADPPSYEYVAREGECLAGYYAALPFSYRIDGEELRCGMVCDVMTSPHMRGKGVFTTLGAHSLTALKSRGVDFVLGYPIRPSVIPGHLKVGWQIAFRLPMYLMPLRANALLATRGFGGLAPVANPIVRLGHLGRRLVAPRSSGLVAQSFDLEGFLAGHDYDAFLHKWLSGRRNALLKSREFLRWRLGTTGADYRCVSVKRGGDLVALSIVRPCELQGVPTLAVLDLMTLGDAPQSVAAMQEQWCLLARETRREVIAAMMSEPHARQLRLWRYGFLRTPAVFSLILNCLSERARAKVLPDPNHWRLMWIDSDDL